MPPGRPSKLSKKIIQDVADSIRRGNYLETAATLAGIQKATLHDWLRQGARLIEAVAQGKLEPNAQERNLIEFSYSVKAAQAEAEARDLALIDEAAHGMIEKKEVKVYERHPETGKMRLVDRREEISTVRDWKAAAWKLERKNPERWGRRTIQVPVAPEEIDPIEWDGEGDED